MPRILAKVPRLLSKVYHLFFGNFLQNLLYVLVLSGVIAFTQTEQLVEFYKTLACRGGAACFQNKEKQNNYTHFLNVVSN